MGRGEMYARFWGEILRGRDYFGDPGVDWMIILRWSSGSGMDDMDWLDLAQYRDRWRVLIKAIMNLRVP